MLFVSRSVHDWNPLVVLSWMPNRVNGAVFTLAWDIYHLPLYDVGSKRHWDKQRVKRCSGLMLGLCETLVVVFTAWSCFSLMGKWIPLMMLLSGFRLHLTCFFFPGARKKVWLSLSLLSSVGRLSARSDSAVKVHISNKCNIWAVLYIKWTSWTDMEI